MSEQELYAILLAQQRELERARSEYQELYELHKYYFEHTNGGKSYDMQCFSDSIDVIDDFYEFGPNITVQTARWEYDTTASFREDRKDRVCNFFGSMSIEIRGKRAQWGFGADTSTLTVLTRHLDEMLTNFAEVYAQVVHASPMEQDEARALLAKLDDFCQRVRAEIKRELT